MIIIAQHFITELFSNLKTEIGFGKWSTLLVDRQSTEQRASDDVMRVTQVKVNSSGRLQTYRYVWLTARRCERGNRPTTTFDHAEDEETKRREWRHAAAADKQKHAQNTQQQTSTQIDYDAIAFFHTWNWPTNHSAHVLWVRTDGSQQTTVQIQQQTANNTVQPFRHIEWRHIRELILMRKVVVWFSVKYGKLMRHHSEKSSSHDVMDIEQVYYRCTFTFWIISTKQSVKNCFRFVW